MSLQFYRNIFYNLQYSHLIFPTSACPQTFENVKDCTTDKMRQIFSGWTWTIIHSPLEEDASASVTALTLLLGGWGNIISKVSLKEN